MIASEQRALGTSALDGPLRLLAVGLPFALAVARASSSGQWRDDLPAVRDLGLVAVGLGGAVSTLVTQILSLAPLGSRAFRASMGSALALGAAAFLLYGMALRALRQHGSADRVAPVLAAIATLTAGLSPTWQREGTVGGGAMLATALGLAAIELALTSAAREAPGLRRGGSTSWVALGALLGVTFAESPPTALAATGSCALVFGLYRFPIVPLPAWLARFRKAKPTPAPTPMRGLWPTRRVAAIAGIAFAFFAALLLAPLALRPLAPRTWIDLGRALSTVRLSALDVAATHTTAIAAWSQEIGVVSLGIALLGAAAGFLRPRGRETVIALLALVVADAIMPASIAGVLTADPLTALRSLALAALTVASALGVNAIVIALCRAPVPLAKAGAVLVVVFHLTLVALTSEEAGFVADRSEQLSAEEWTDQALGALEPRSVILVRSPALAWRLWAAQTVRGERPDVLIVPVALLDRGRVAASLAAADHALEPLLRSYALVGEPSEFALSKLADVRPLHVEMDPAWSKRQVTHLAIDGMWLEYAPEPLGPSDRKLATAATLAPMRRVLAAARLPVVPDASTSSILVSTLRDQAEVLALLGERDAAKTFADRMSELAPTDPLAGAGWLRLAFVGSLPAGRARRGDAPARRR